MGRRIAYGQHWTVFGDDYQIIDVNPPRHFGAKPGTVVVKRNGGAAERVTRALIMRGQLTWDPVRGAIPLNEGRPRRRRGR